jgi:hypothetical protein
MESDPESSTQKSGLRNVLDFGAVADGSCDASEAIQAALDSGARHILIPDGEYLLRNALFPREGQALEIHGTLRIANAVVSPLALDLEIGADHVEVEDPTLFWVGQSVMVYDDKLPVQGGGHKVRRQNAGCAHIESISGRTLQLSQSSARHYEVGAGALLASVHSAILVHASKVRIFGSGLIDCNKAGQFHACPGRLDCVEGVESIQGCGVAVAAFPNRLTDIVVEGITVVEPLLHGIRMKDCDHSVIRNTRCLRAHDKNITLERVRDCEVSHNFACDSEWEDGIQFHQKADPERSSHRVRIIGNTCTGNARVGLGVGAGMFDFHLAHNLCAFNGTNISLRGDRITSIGDTAIGGNDRLFPYSGPRPNVSIAGRFIEMQNLTALGTPAAAVGIGGTDITISGGRVGDLEKSLDGFEGVAFDFQPVNRASDQPLSKPDRVVIAGVRVSGCRVVLRAAEGTGSVVLRQNQFPVDCDKWEMPDALHPNFAFLENEGWVFQSRGQARFAPGEDCQRIRHGLCRRPDIASASISAASKGASGAFIHSVAGDEMEIRLAEPAGSSGEMVIWSVDASRVGTA